MAGSVTDEQVLGVEYRTALLEQLQALNCQQANLKSIATCGIDCATLRADIADMIRKLTAIYQLYFGALEP